MISETGPRLAITSGSEQPAKSILPDATEVEPVQPPEVYGQDLNAHDILHSNHADQAVTRQLAQEFGIGPVYDRAYPLHHSTTSKKIIIISDSGRYFLKEKAAYAAADEDIEFCGAFQNYLATLTNSVPPLLEGNHPFHTTYGTKKYILMPAIEGEPFMGKVEQLRSSATALAQIHNLSEGFATHSGPFKSSVHEAQSFLEMASSLPNSDNDPSKEYLLKSLADIVDQPIIDEHQLSESLRKIVTHGDFSPSNLLFEINGGVAGVLDFDNSAYRLRIRDLAEALMTFCGGVNYAGNTSSLRRPIASSLDLDMTRQFYEAYTHNLTIPLSGQERGQLVEEMKLAWVELMCLGIVRGDFNYTDVMNGLGYISNLGSIREIITPAKQNP